MEPMQVGKYKIVARIGEGAMGEVYRAHDPALHRYVAIKTISQSRDAEPEHRRRFLREARSAAQLNHPNIVTVYDFGDDNGRIYMAMELLEGSDLKDLIREKNPLPLKEKLRLMGQICEGVGYAHTKGIVHRDLKPGNIHVQPNGQVKIMDFGLARLASSDMTKTGVILGTPNYMSPEQVQAQAVDARSDVFSLGAVFYELLCNRKPFDADSIHATLFKVVQGEREPVTRWNPNLPEPVVRIIDKALSKQPEKRYQDARELLRALQEVSMRMGSALEAEDIWSPDLQETIADDSARVTRTPSSAKARSTPPAPAIVPLPASRATLRRAGLRSSRWLYAGVGVVLLGAIAGVAYHFSNPSPQSAVAQSAPAQEPVVPTGPSFAQDLDRARDSLDAKDYRGAAAIAGTILEQQADNQDAKRIQDEARGALEQLDRSLEQARTLLDAGQEEQAARQLAVALAVDPNHPMAVELSNRLNSQFRGEVEATRRRADQSRDKAIQAGAGTIESFQRAASLYAQAKTELDGRRYAASTQKFLAAGELYERALREKQEADGQALAEAQRRAEWQQAASEWKRLQGRAGSDSLEKQPAFRAALALASEAEQLAAGGDYSAAATAYRDAVRRLDEAEEQARLEASQRAAEEAAARPEPASAPSTPPPEPVQPPVEARPEAEQDADAIRNVVSTWERAIESQDIELYKLVKPNLSANDEQRLRDSFAAVETQQVEISILGIDLQGERATVRLARADAIVVKGKSRQSRVEQTLVLSKKAGRWVIDEIGE